MKSQALLSLTRFFFAQYPTAIDLVAEGKISANLLITHRYGFQGIEDVIGGFDCALNASKTKAIKVMFNLPEI